MSIKAPLLDPQLDFPTLVDQESHEQSTNTCRGRVWRVLSLCCSPIGKCIKTVCHVAKDALVETGKMLFTTSRGSLVLTATSATCIPFTTEHWQLSLYAVLGCMVEDFSQKRDVERLLRSVEDPLHCGTKSLDYLQDIKKQVGRFDNIIARVPLMIHGSYPDIAYPFGAFLTGIAFNAKGYEIKYLWGKDKELTFKEINRYTLLWYTIFTSTSVTAVGLADRIEDESYRKICKELGFLMAWKPIGTETLRFIHYSALVLECSTHCAVRCAKNVAQFFRSIFTFPSVIVALSLTLRALYEEDEDVEMTSMALLGFALGCKNPLFKSTVLPLEEVISPEMVSRCRKICFIALSWLFQLALLAFAVQDILDPSTENRLHLPYEGAVFIFSAFFMYYLRFFSRKYACPLGRGIIDFTDRNLLESVVISLYLIDYAQTNPKIAYALLVSTAFSVMIATEDTLNGRGKNPKAPGRLHAADTPYGPRVLSIV